MVFLMTVLFTVPCVYGCNKILNAPRNTRDDVDCILFYLNVYSTQF